MSDAETSRAQERLAEALRAQGSTERARCLARRRQQLLDGMLYYCKGGEKECLKTGVGQWCWKRHADEPARELARWSSARRVPLKG